MKTAKHLVWLLSLSLVAGSGIAAADTILVFGDRFERSTLASDLVDLGHMVTNVETLPADLDGFDAIWHVGAFAPLSEDERGRLASFIANGGGVHLTGERPCCEILNDSLEALVNALVVDGGITVGGQGDIAGPYPFHAEAKNGVARKPNELVSWNPDASGGLAGLASANVLVRGAGEVPVGAVWAGSDLSTGRGALTVLMDVNWFTRSGRIPVIENIQTLFACGNGVVSEHEDCDDGTRNGASGSCCTVTCTAEPAGTTCDDDDACTLEDTCDGGVCQPGGSTLLMPAADLDQTVQCIEQTIADALP